MDIKKLTSEEIQELDISAAQRILGHNTGLLADIGNALFTASQDLGEARIKVEQLKHYKDIITEQNRALKSMVSGG